MASVSVDDMRYLIARVYPSDNWKKRVRRMSDNQVCAIYFSFLKQGKFEKKKKPVSLPPDGWDLMECDISEKEPCESGVDPRTDAFAVDTAEQLYFEL